MAVYLGQNEVILRNGISTTDADAIAADILVGKTAYVNDIKLIGTRPLADSTDSRVGTLFTGATIPLTFKNNTNIYENEYDYKSERYNVTITGLDSVATITDNGSKNVKVAFAVSSSTDSITMFNINIANDTESYDFVGRFFYYGQEVADGNCLAVASKILPESGAGDFSNFEIIESSTYPLFSTNTVSWEGVFSHQIIGFIFAKKSTPIEDYFLYNCYAFNQPLTLPLELTSIGKSFFYGCFAFNQPLILPSGLTSIGNNFLQGCMSFNQPLILPSELTSIGDRFLDESFAFNQPLTLPSGLTSIGDSFLNMCFAFNQPLTLPSGLTSIGDYFLQGCAFNRPLTLPSGLTSIGDNFLQGCVSFNQPLILPSGLTSIGARFLAECYAFNQLLTFPSWLTSIGTEFLYNCYAFTLLEYNSSVYLGGTNSLNSLSQNIDTKTSTNGTGIKVIGTNAEGLKAALPNRTTDPFRKLV